LDVEEILSQPKQQEFEEDYQTRVCSRDAKERGVKTSVQPGDEGGEEDVGYEGHEGDVHIRTVDILSWGEEFCASAVGVLIPKLANKHAGKQVFDSKAMLQACLPFTGCASGRGFVLTIRLCCRDQGRWRQGNRTMRSLERT